MVGPRRARTDDGRSRRRRDDGAAAVEFALVLPIFVALLFGVISYGWMLSYRQGISQAAAEGARAMAVAPSGSTTALSDARAAINRSLSSYHVECTDAGTLTHDGTVVGTCTITPPFTCPGSTNKCAKVALSHAYRSHPLIPSFPGLGIVLPDEIGYETTSEINS
jgi:Flp pilus assembly protein TadG